MHRRVTGPELSGDQLTLFVMGLLFLAIYFVTKNLLVAVGLHAIGNDPAPLIQASDGVVSTVWFYVVLLFAFLWISLPPTRKWRTLIRQRVVTN